jgi:endonuclease/exonuclease/phosphatase family metal-dependent hydrolase
VARIQPLIALLNETRQAHKFHNYNEHISEPAPGARHKRNAMILTHQNLHFTPRLTTVDYVSGVATGNPLRKPTFVACIYLNPEVNAVRTTREAALLAAERDLMELTMNINTREFDIIFGGDFNMDAEDMEFEYVNGSWLFQHLNTLHRSSSGPTSHHRGGSREIDFIFSTQEIRNIRDCLPNARRLSDHNPVCVAVECSNEPSRITIPDRELANEILHRLLEMDDPRPRDHLRLVEEYARAGRHTLKEIDIQETWRRKLNKIELDRVGDPKHIEKKRKQLDRDLEQIIQDRFSREAGAAFKRLRRLTHYHEYEKRDGGFMNRAYVEGGGLIVGEELNARVMDHYSRLHNLVPDN